MVTTRRNPKVPELTFFQKRGVFIGASMGIIIGLLIGFSIPALVDIPFGTQCSCDIGFSVSEDFTLSVKNGTDDTWIHEDSDQFDPLIVMLSVIEFDPIIIQAYKDNVTEGIPLNETITENKATYMSYKNIMIGNAKLQLFLTELFDLINGSLPEPTEDELLELLTPMARGEVTTTKSYKPVLLAGMSIIMGNQTWLNDPESINMTDPLEIFNNTYIIQTGFIENTNPLTLSVPAVLESPFFVEDCSNLNFVLNHVEINSTIEDDVPLCDLVSYEATLNGVDINGDFNYIPLNIIGLLMTLITLFEDVIL